MFFTRKIHYYFTGIAHVVFGQFWILILAYCYANSSYRYGYARELRNKSNVFLYILFLLLSNLALRGRVFGVVVYHWLWKIDIRFAFIE